MFVRFKGKVVDELRIVHFKNKELYKDFLDKYYDKQFSYANGTSYKEALRYYDKYYDEFCVWIHNNAGLNNKYTNLSFGSLSYARSYYANTNIEEYTIDNNNKLEIE